MDEQKQKGDVREATKDALNWPLGKMGDDCEGLWQGPTSKHDHVNPRDPQRRSGGRWISTSSRIDLINKEEIGEISF